MKLFKDILMRFFVGFAAASLLGSIIDIVVSAAVGNGEYMPVMPPLRAQFETELGAVICQFILVGLIGVLFAEGALVFKIEKWSLMKQYIVHFIITSVFYTPFVYICWMPENLREVLILLANYIFTYALTYILRYRAAKADIDKINKAINEKNAS